MHKERRGGLDEHRFEYRMADDEAAGKTVSISGYAALFNHDSSWTMDFIERIAPGAFSEALARPDNVMLTISHGDMPLARNTSGTLRLAEDERGLRVEADLDLRDPDAQGVAVKMERGDLYAMSFLFMAERDQWDHSGEVAVRTIQSVRLFDVALVGMPAYDGADVALRSAQNAFEKRLASQNFRAAEQRRRRLDLARRANAL